MKTTAVFFPFDLFGGGGSGAGVGLLADALREMLADNKRETARTRAAAYAGQVRLRETVFEKLEDLADWRRTGRQLARATLHKGDFMFWIAGNHLGVLPVYDELSAEGESFVVVQFDAHLDIHKFRDCTTEPSHGNFLLHCDGPVPPIINVGHRDLLLPAEHIGRYYRHTFSAAQTAIDLAAVASQLRALTETVDRVLLDIDCDVLDPAHFPAVSEPVPFGLAPPALLALIEAIWSPRVAGVCLSEFNPARDRDDCCLATLVWLIEYLLLRRYEAGHHLPGS
jgi:arginase family enzyme